MPDGTNLGGVSSNLVSTLNQDLGPNWVQSLQDAFAQWENSANVNVVQVSDNGAPFNSGNYQQNSPSFGDIRIGGFVQDSSVLAFTMLPPPNNGGSDAGDIFFNTAQAWHINSDFDFETVAVHEIGHAVAGLGESSDPRAAEYEYYNGIKQGLAQDDVNGIQALWGPRQEDPIEQATHNLTAANAATCNYVINSVNQVVLPGLNVASSSDVYWFKVTTPANASNVFTAQVQSTNLSELSPRVAIYNANLQGLVQVSASTTAYGATIAATITNVTPNTTYYIKVLPSTVGANGTGAYDLTLNMGTQPIAMLAPPDTTVYAQPDQGGYGIFEKTAQAILPAHPTAVTVQPGVDESNLLEGTGFLVPLIPHPVDHVAMPVQNGVIHPVNVGWTIRQKPPIAQAKIEGTNQE